MKIRMDRILQELIENACEDAHLGRTPRIRDQTTVLAKILARLEANGDAMRYVDGNGRIAWRATPKLREHLKELEADARADDEHEAA